VPTDGWLNDQRYFATEAPESVAAVVRNLQRYLKLLRASENSKAVEAMYLKPEISGIVAVDQSGLGDFKEQLRIYTFADDMRKLLFLLAFGKAETKHSDMEYCKNLVYYIINEQRTG